MQYPFQAHTLLKKKLLISIITKFRQTTVIKG